MPLAAALVGAVAISFSAIFFALSGLEPIAGAFYRFAYAIPLLAVLWLRVRDQDERSRKARWLAFAAGVMLGLDVAAWHISIEYIGTGLATLIANCQVIIVSILAWVLFGERPSRVVVVSVPVVLGGLALVSGLGSGDPFGTDPLRGTLWAVTAAVAYSGFLLGYRRSNRVQSPTVGSLLDAAAGAAITALILSPIQGGVTAPTWPAHGWLLALALVSQVGGWLAIGYALPRLPAAETSTFILLQPVLTMTWGAIIFAERPSALQLGGAVLVLTGVAAVAVTRGRPVRVPARS